MVYEIVISPLATQEIIEAFDWYKLSKKAWEMSSYYSLKNSLTPF